jgi:hypothetical protein
MQVEIFETGDGCGYRIRDAEQNICIEQSFKPGVRGFVPMTREEAEQAAAAIVGELKAVTG